MFLGREAETRVGFALQRGQVEQARRHRGGRLRLLSHIALLALARQRDRIGGGFAPQALGTPLRIVLVFLEVGVQPAAFINAGRAHEFGAHFPVIARDETLDLLFALDHDRQGRRLHAAHGGQVEAALFRVEGGHGAGAVDADQPVRFRAATRGVGQRQHFVVAAQVREAVADRVRRHRLQPQALDRLLGFRILRNQAEDQFTFAARVACVNQGGDVLALDQLVQHLEPRFSLGDRVQCKVRRDHRQMGESPFAALDVVFFRHGDFQQVTHCGRQHVVVGFEILIVLAEAAKGFRDVVRDRRFLSDDEGFTHIYSSRRCMRQRA